MKRMLKHILSGMGAALAWYPAGRYTHYHGLGSERPLTDYDALSQDVEAIGRDFYTAVGQGAPCVTEALSRRPD